jgi:hypothetical protein
MIAIEKWSGLITAASPYALPGGAMAAQVNLQCLRPGQVECRNGYIQAITSPPVVAAVRYSTGTQDRLFVMAGGAFYIFTP